jgi:mRNA-degrading endonuclease RelE of RelBE toxin-antitoxin system
MPFTMEISRTAERNLNAIRVYERRQIVDAIERGLTSQPSVASRNRKRLDEAKPPFEHVPPLWELRVGEYRVYYDVNEKREIVFIRAVRRKPPHKTTQEVFDAKDDD